MARNDHKGGKKPRKTGTRIPLLGYYLIITNTDATELCYFTGLLDSLPESIKEKIVIKVIKADTEKLVDKCNEVLAYNSQYRIPWIVFDRDQVKDFDKIIQEATDNGFSVGWSNPCLEIWFFAYFGVMPVILESKKCVSEFGKLYKEKTGQKYSKTDQDIYKKMIGAGDEVTALQIAEQKIDQHKREEKNMPSEMCPATTVYELVKEIKDKAEN